MPRVRAPELPSHYVWLNCDRPLSLKALRGRFVLLDFWTYGCINCLHVLPDLKYLEQKYSASLMVIGIHSAKFEQEKETDNIRQAILRHDLEHPVLVDRHLEVWQQYAVRAYPTLVLIDPAGYVIRSAAGEGQRETLDDLLSTLIQKYQSQNKIHFQEMNLLLEKQQHPVLTPLAFPGKVLADEASDRLFIADSGHHRLIVSTLNSEVLHLVGTGTRGLTDGAITHAQFATPQGMAWDRANQLLYVADTENHVVRRVDLMRGIVETIAGTGAQNPILRPQTGIALETALNSPWDLELMGDRLFIAMAGSHQIWQLQLSTNLSTNTVMTYAGTGAEGWADGQTVSAAFAQPSGLTTDGQELFIADSEISSIRAIELFSRSRANLTGTIADGTHPLPLVRTVCGSGDLYDAGDVDGIGEQVRLQHCLGVEFAHGVLWVADTYNHKIKQVDVQRGRCQSVLGNGQAGYLDGQGQTAQFFEPSGISATSTHLYIADTNNHVIRQVEFQTLTVRTIAFPELCSPTVCLPKTDIGTLPQ